MKVTASVLGYIFLSEQKNNSMTEKEQRAKINEYASSLGIVIDDIFIERQGSLQRPFAEREEGARMLLQCCSGDIILLARAEWVLSSANEGQRLLRMLRKNQIALHCIDLGGNISLDEKRTLRVHEGYAGIVQKILAALAACENGKHGEAIRAAKQNLKRQGKYLGGPVPFGWDVDGEGYFVQNAAQQDIIAAIIALRKDRWSYRDISKKLKNEFAVHLSHAGVRKVLDGNRKRKSAEFVGKKTKEQ